jgi:two-component system, NarL family, nitrate/nitrite response regulator NarL
MDHHEIWLIARSKLFREGLKLLLAESEFRVTREVPDIGALEQMRRDAAPSLVLISVSSNTEQAQEERSVIERACRLQTAPVIVLADTLSMPQLLSAMTAGASGYLLRDIDAEALKQSMALVLTGEKVLPSELVAMLLDNSLIRASVQPVPGSVNLSPREENILSAVANGYSNKTIANTMNITEGTVKVHMKALFRKVQARNRTEAAIWALDHGIRDHPASIAPPPSSACGSGCKG